ncbi:sensor histidine kinase [Nocardioides zeicaulis]|uniref:histidine kinase n=1 Tax=Nocardioides zeicaulis TaxID=1776857 RepID=A0ABV6DXT9_9ACTN
MLTVLRQLWRLPAPPDGAVTVRPARVDLGLVVVFGVCGVLEAALTQPAPAWRWLSLAALLTWLPTLPLRRSRPLVPVVVFTATAVALAVVGQVSGTVASDLSAAAVALVIPYSLARWAPGREAAVGLALFGLVAATSLAVQDLAAGDRVGGSAVVVAAVALGVALRSRAMLRVRELDDVRRGERERLARDLHDTVAHHLTAIAISAQAGLAVADVDPAAARDALRRIDEEATRTLAETRTVVRALRDDGAAPDRPLDDLAGLAAPATAGGPTVRVHLDDVADLSPTVAAALHRIAQEAVANARRHARHATRVDVRVTRRDDEVELVVTDDGAAHPPGAEGFGLVGMTERATLLGGTLSAGPDPRGGWCVHAVLPDGDDRSARGGRTGAVR